MWPRKSSSPYLPVATTDDNDNNGCELRSLQSRASGAQPRSNIAALYRTRFLRPTISILLLILFISVLASYIADEASEQPSRPNTSSFNCNRPPRRREWRQLSVTEKGSYITAVKCLHELPSIVTGDGHLSDDFPWVHYKIGSYSHNAAAFLAWHRYFIHIYETMLQTKCSYDGYLAYWDWTLDWEDPNSSPIWDPDTGFGGDGGTEQIETVGFGSCIENGPFRNYEVLYYNATISPHCLSRGFGWRHQPARFPGGSIMPSTMEEIHLQESFFNFSMSLEALPHNYIHNNVLGDFYLYEAPNDPVFFLHHAQLDRLWSLWQKESADRLSLYQGPSIENSLELASLDDTLPMHGLGSDITVREVMSTRSGILCYDY